MKTNRSNFLKSAGALTAGVVISPSIISCNKSKDEDVKFADTLNEVRKSRKQHFNMCGYAAPPLDQDVYDAALWSSMVALTEWSVANDSEPIEVPDFTCGAYKTNQPIDISMEKGGNTGVRLESIRTDEPVKQQNV